MQTSQWYQYPQYPAMYPAAGATYAPQMYMGYPHSYYQAAQHGLQFGWGQMTPSTTPSDPSHLHTIIPEDSKTNVFASCDQSSVAAAWQAAPSQYGAYSTPVPAATPAPLLPRDHIKSSPSSPPSSDESAEWGYNSTSSVSPPEESSALMSSGKRVRKRPLESGKPPYSYIALICMSITNAPDKKATLREIIDYIDKRFPFYTRSKSWHGSIRHNLTLNDCFIKTPRRDGDKGHPWAIDASFEDMFDSGSLMRRRYRYKEGSAKWLRSRKQAARRAATAATSKPLTPAATPATPTALHSPPSYSPTLQSEIVPYATPATHAAFHSPPSYSPTPQSKVVPYATPATHAAFHSPPSYSPTLQSEVVPYATSGTPASLHSPPSYSPTLQSEVVPYPTSPSLQPIHNSPIEHVADASFLSIAESYIGSPLDMVQDAFSSSDSSFDQLPSCQALILTNATSHSTTSVFDDLIKTEGALSLPSRDIGVSAGDLYSGFQEGFSCL